MFSRPSTSTRKVILQSEKRTRHRATRRRSLFLESLEDRRLLTTFTTTSPIGGGQPVPAGVTEVGGVVIDMVGANGARITSQLAASSLFAGFFNTGAPMSFQGNPGTIGVETGFNAALVSALGGGIAEIAIRLTIDDGDTKAGNFDFNNNEFRLNGITFGNSASAANFSSVATQRTSSNGLTLISSGNGFGDGTLDTGWFYTTNATFLTNLYNSIQSSGQIAVQLYDTDPYDNFFNFGSGVDGGLINVGQPPNVAPTIMSVTNSGPVNEGSPVTVTIHATDPDNTVGGLSYQFDFNNDGIYEVGPQASNSASHTYADDNPSLTSADPYTIRVRVSDTRGGIDTDSTVVIVNNVAPTPTILSISTPRIEGTAIAVSGSATDPAGTNDTLSYAWSVLKDGMPFTTAAGSNFSFTPDDNGSYKISLTVSDDDGGSTTVDSTISVENAAPVIAVSGAASVDEGSLYTLTLGAVTDPGADTVSSYVVHWGDGNSDTYTTAGAKTHTYADGPNDYVISVSLIDEDVYQGLDPSFGQGGKVVSDFGTDYFVGAMTLDSQGRIIVLADTKLVRYKTDGSLDFTFGVNGQLQLPSTGIDVQGLAIDPAGRFLTVGRKFTFDSSINGQNWDIAVARYNPNGMLDNGFGTGGIKVLEVSGPTTTTVRRFDYGQGIALNSAGEIFIAGYTEESFNSPSSWNQDIVVAKLTSAGELDPSFGNQGIVRYDFRNVGQPFSFDQAEDIAVLSNGDLVIVGSTDQIGKSLLRLTPQGELVGTFGNGGRAPISQVVPYFTSFQPTSVAEDTEGRLIVGGFGYGTPNVSNYDFMMMRYTANGQRDPGFANSGIAAIGFSGFEKAVDVQVDAQGRIVIAGDAQMSAGMGWQTNIAMARWIADSAYLAVAEMPVTVNNVAPTPTILSISTARVEGTAIAVIGSATDPADANDTLSYAWSVLKDGAPFATAVGSGFSFTPDDNGSYNISLTVNDEDGGSTTVDSTISVDNVAPTPTIVSISTPRVEGTAIAVIGSATDPAGANDTLSYAWSVLKDGVPFTTAVGSGFSFTPDDNGSYNISLTVNDEDGSSTTVDSTISVDNVAPTPTIVSISTPRVEGTAIAVIGSATDPASANDTVSYAWSVLKDGVPFATAVGSGFSFTPDDNGSYNISLTVNDEDGGSTTVDSTISVDNVAPVITTFTTDSPFCGGADEHESVTATLDFTDPGSLDTHEVTINWGDGNSETLQLTGGERTLSPTHSYATGGVFDVTVSVEDDDTGIDFGSTTVVVTGVGVVGNTLYVVGTDDADHVSINQTGNGLIKVHASFLANPDTPRVINPSDYPGGISQILMILCGGDDHATISDRVMLPAIIDGGEGDDHLKAGGGGAVLLGGHGKDMLVGGSGSDILIGGVGLDRLVGGSTDDVLIGGSTSIDHDDDALKAALLIWGGADAYATRVAAIDALWSVWDDEEEDKLTGSSGLDLFYSGLGDSLTDVKNNELTF